MGIIFWQWLNRICHLLNIVFKHYEYLLPLQQKLNSMKKITTLLCIQWLLIGSSHSQNIGIGNTNPAARLDINGDIAIRSTDIIISTTYNYALDVNTARQACYKLKNSAVPVGNFILAGIASGADGRMITLMNRTGAGMEIYNDEAAATAANRILTGTGSNLAVYNNGTVTLQYDASQSRWVITGMHNNSLNYFGGGGGTSSWDIAGNNISNNNTGNVGVGTASPSFKLDVNGNERITGTALTAPGLFGSLTSGGSLRIENTSNNFFLKTDGSKIQAEKSNTLTSGTTASTLSINPHGGNVGIGIDGDIPYKLSIYQPVIESNSNTSVLQLRGQNPLVNFVDQFNTSRGYIKGVTNNSQTQYPGVGIAIGASDLNDGAGNFGDIYLLGKGYQPTITIKGTNNNVGINYTTPLAQLFVRKTSNTDSPEGSFACFGTTYGSYFHYGSAEDTYIRGGKDGSKVIINDGALGNVGIGTSNPTEKLSVNGHIRAKEIVVETGWADYVFEKAYKLKPLSEVEIFIQQNNHLPNIPSAAEIQINGLKVGEVQTKMMEKIEEMTLYIIELNKEIELLKLNDAKK